MHETFTFFNSWVDIEVKLHWINEVDHGIVSVDGSEIPFPTTVGMLRKTLEIMGFQLPTSTGEFTGFLNHQQYGMSMWNVKLRTSKRIATSTAWNRCCFLYRLWGSISSRAYYSDLLRRQRGRWIRFLLHLQGQFLQRSLVTFPHELIKAPHLRFVGKRYPRLLFSPWPRVHGNSLEFLSNFGCNLPWPPRAHRIRLDRKPMAIALLQWKPIVQRSQAHHRRRQIFSVDEKFWPCLFSNVGKVCIFCHVATFPFSEPIASPLLFLHSPLYQVCPWRPSHGGIANAADPPCLDSKGDETGQPTNGPFAHGDTCEPKCQDGYTRSSTFGWKNWKVKEVIIEMMHSVFFLYDCVFHAKKKVMGWCVSKSENHQLKFQDLSRSKWRCPPLRIAVDLHHSERFRLPIGYLALVALVGKLLGFSSDLSGIDSFSWSGIWDFNHCSEIRIISWHVWTPCKYCDILLINWWLPDVWTINTIALHPFSTK